MVQNTYKLCTGEALFEAVSFSFFDQPNGSGFEDWSPEQSSTRVRTLITFPTNDNYPRTLIKFTESVPNPRTLIKFAEILFEF